MEFKFNEAPNVTKSMVSALTDLSLAHLWVVYPGAVRYAAHQQITMLPLAEVSGLRTEILKWKCSIWEVDQICTTSISEHLSTVITLVK